MHHALESKVVTLHTKIKGRFKTRRRGRQSGFEDLRDDAGPHDHRRTAAAHVKVRSTGATS
jgi:hypothetical protein